jgi:alpha-amylase
MNETIFQFFHWYFPAEAKLWQSAAAEAKQLAALGVTYVWLPPAYKSAKGNREPGYAVYDTYDLGEFDQKGSVATKHGTKQEYLDCINALHGQKIRVLADIVLNHRFEGDRKELVKVVEVKEKNRHKTVSEEHTIEAATGFSFPGRNRQYSSFEWDHTCFTGLCDDGKVKLIVHEFTKEGWEAVPDTQHGNFDFLMANDIEFRNPAVRIELMRWINWYVNTTGVDGFRIDGLKHIAPDFFPAWLDHLHASGTKSFFAIGEYWKNDVKHLLHYLKLTGRRIKLFDVPLHFNFYNASTDKHFDLRKIFAGTLVEQAPASAITIVDNHDTQPLQSLESTIEPWFKPLAYALILLREQGIPCVFYPAVYGASYTGTDSKGKEVEVKMEAMPAVSEMMRVRKNCAYGLQTDYFKHRHLVGWTRAGSGNDPQTGCAVVISNRSEGELAMSMGDHHAGQMFYDVTGNISGAVLLNEKGEGVFPVKEKNVSVYIPYLKNDI